MEFSITALSGQSAVSLITSGEFCVLPMLGHKTRGLFKDSQFMLKERRRAEQQVGEKSQEQPVGRERLLDWSRLITDMGICHILGKWILFPPSEFV